MGGCGCGSIQHFIDNLFKYWPQIKNRMRKCLKDLRTGLSILCNVFRVIQYSVSWPNLNSVSSPYIFWFLSLDICYIFGIYKECLNVIVVSSTLHYWWFHMSFKTLHDTICLNLCSVNKTCQKRQIFEWAKFDTC